MYLFSNRRRKAVVFVGTHNRAYQAASLWATTAVRDPSCSSDHQSAVGLEQVARDSGLE